MAVTPYHAQLIDRANQTLIREAGIIMAKQEIVSRTLDPLRNLWWKFMPGVKINVTWPDGDVVIDESMPQWDWTVGPSKYIVSSADPNDHYRPWLEKNVGKQGWDWDWRLGPITGAKGQPNGPIVLAGDFLEIKFRKGKEKYATIATLKWLK